MILRSYFDAANQADSTQYDVLSLAAVCGTINEWRPFERDWNKVLAKHNAPWLHTTDAVGRRDIYANWTESARDSLIKDCAKVAGKHIARLNRPDAPGRYGILPVLVSIVLKDYVRARETLKDCPTNANELCLRHILPELFVWSRDNAKCDEDHFVFDQGEPFYGHLHQLLTSKKAVRMACALQRITSRTEANMRKVPALQLADLFAWCVSHKSAEWQPAWKIKMLSFDRLDLWFDETNMYNADHAQQQVWASWKLQKRKATL